MNKIVLGVCLLAWPPVLLALFSAHTIGLSQTLSAFFVTALVVSSLYLGLYLLTK